MPPGNTVTVAHLEFIHYLNTRGTPPRNISFFRYEFLTLYSSNTRIQPRSSRFFFGRVSVRNSKKNIRGFFS